MQQLSELRRQGAITDTEFAAAKQQLLSAGGKDSGRRAATPPSATPSPLPAPQPPPRTQAFTEDFTRWPSPVAQATTRKTQRRPYHPPPRYGARTNPNGPPPPANTARKLAGHSGAVTSAAAGAVVLLAFLVLPMATVPVLGSISASGLAGESSLFGPLGLLWLVPVEALAIIGLAALQVLSSPTRQACRARSLGIIVVAGGVWATYCGVLVSLQSRITQLSERLSISTFFGYGLWFAIVAAAVAAVGGVIEMAWRR
jgi:hypothetical protein